LGNSPSPSAKGNVQKVVINGYDLSIRFSDFPAGETAPCPCRPDPLAKIAELATNPCIASSPGVSLQRHNPKTCMTQSRRSRIEAAITLLPGLALVGVALFLHYEYQPLKSSGDASLAARQLVWIIDTIGLTPTVILVAAIGLLVITIAIRGLLRPSDPPPAP